MKCKTDFITNSSSTAFFITNKTNETKTLVDFVKENPQLGKQYIQQYCYDWENKQIFSQKNLLKSARTEQDITFNPHETKYCIFGDEDGTLIGRVFDYILRPGGSSKSFSWKYHESLR